MKRAEAWCAELEAVADDLRAENARLREAGERVARERRLEADSWARERARWRAQERPTRAGHARPLQRGVFG